MTTKITIAEVDDLKRKSPNSHKAFLRLLAEDRLPKIRRKYRQQLKETKPGKENIHLGFLSQATARKFCRDMESRGIPTNRTGQWVQIQIKYLVRL